MPYIYTKSFVVNCNLRSQDPMDWEQIFKKHEKPKMDS